MTQDSLSSEALEMLNCEFVDVETSLEDGSEEDARKVLGVGLLGRVESIVASFRYLRSKARVGTKQQEQEDGSLVSEVTGTSKSHGSLVIEDGDAYSLMMVESMQMVMDVLGSLVTRVTLAESETAFHKERVVFGEEVMRWKTGQIDNLSLRLEEMKAVVCEHKTLLDEAMETIEKLVEDNRRDREKALDNEEELRLMKSECEELRDYVNTSINVTYTQLVAKSKKLEGEKAEKEIEVQKLTEKKAQKELEVQKLMEENMKLAALLDKKEAHISALNEQCKLMALNASNI